MLKINETVIELKNYPDGTLLIKDDTYINNDSVTITWKYESDSELFALVCLTKHLKNKNCDINLQLFYCPNSRMDRIKNPEDIFTLKYFTDIINYLDFTSVRVLDPHSNVTEALINNIVVDSPGKYITRASMSCEPDMMFYPDEGAMKRYSDKSELPYAFGIKKRDWATGQIQGLDVAGCIDKIKDSKILIVDDICSRGGTFYHSAKKLKELGAKEIYLYVTHCENTILEGELIASNFIEKVYTTNSIFTKEHEKIEVFEL